MEVTLSEMQIVLGTCVVVSVCVVFIFCWLAEKYDRVGTFSVTTFVMILLSLAACLVAGKTIDDKEKHARAIVLEQTKIAQVAKLPVKWQNLRSVLVANSSRSYSGLDLIVDEFLKRDNSHITIEQRNTLIDNMGWNTDYRNWLGKKIAPLVDVDYDALVASNVPATVIDSTQLAQSGD